MTPFHDPECRRLMGYQKQRITKFRKRFPNYCQHCAACGYYLERNYFGDEQEYPCLHCYGLGLCPRCMTPTLVKTRDRSYTSYEYIHSVCSTCSWRDDDESPEKMMLPSDPQCVCVAVRQVRARKDAHGELQTKTTTAT